MKHWSDSYQQLSKTTPNLSERATLFLSLSLSNTHTHARTHLHAHLLPMITTFCLEVEPETVGIIWKLGGHSSCSSSREAWETCFCIIYIYIFFARNDDVMSRTRIIRTFMWGRLHSSFRQTSKVCPELWTYIYSLNVSLCILLNLILKSCYYYFNSSYLSLLCMVDL